MAEPVEQQEVVTRFTPSLDEPLLGEESLARSQDDLERFPNEIDLIVQQEEPPPLGRSVAFDWTGGRFFRSQAQRGPLETRGIASLKEWVAKCLNTARGAHPVHPTGYGLVRADDMIGGPVGSPPADLKDRIRDALTFHPRIEDVVDFVFDENPDDEFYGVSFTVVTDSSDRVPVEAVPLGFL